MQSYWFYTCLCLGINLALSSSSSNVSYNDHCSSIVPESNPTIPTNKAYIPHLSTPYITGGDRLIHKLRNQTYYYVGKNLQLWILPDNYETNATSIFKVAGVLNIGLPFSYNRDHTLHSYDGSGQTRGTIRFLMNGFWSENTRKLCMVGSSSWEVERDTVIDLHAALKLNYASESNPTIFSNVVSGILESTALSENDAAYFEPILIFSFPVSPYYNHSLISKQDGLDDFDVLADESLSLRPAKFCSGFGSGQTVVELEYEVKCSKEPQHCSPLGGTLPRVLLLRPIECSEHDRKLRYTAIFHNMSQDFEIFNPDLVVVGEASWDDEKRHLFGIACRLLNPLNHFGNAVEDCSMMLRLWHTSVLTIRNDAKIAGKLWSTKTVKDSGYFRKISLASAYENGVVGFRERRYEYTEMDRVRELCPLKKPVKKGYTYPDARSLNMRFHVLIKTSKGHTLSWSYASPVSIENDMADAVWPVVPESSDIEEVGVSKPQQRPNNSYTKISYKIGLNIFPDVKASNLFPSLNGSINLHHQADMMTEGVYYAETGQLCMVGSRKLVVNGTYFLRDSEILVKLEFPPLNSMRGGLVKGTIRSRRAKEDPLYFDDLVLQSAAPYAEVAERSVWRMDLKIIMVLISNVLACIFVGLQIFHVKRNLEVPSFISLVMLVILCVGDMIPLVLNFDAVFGRLVGNELSVRVITVVALLLKIHLLQLVWTAKQKDAVWFGEKKVGVVSLALYILGGMIALFLNWITNRSYSSIYGDLRSYVGLILDGFLVPQILLNIFSGSAEKTLCHPFYIGTSLVRLLPHAYNLYRTHNYPEFDLKTATYYFAYPTSDFYSTAWDIMIPCGVVALVVVVFVQQRLNSPSKTRKVRKSVCSRQ